MSEGKVKWSLSGANTVQQNKGVSKHERDHRAVLLSLFGNVNDTILMVLQTYHLRSLQYSVNTVKQSLLNKSFTDHPCNYPSLGFLLCDCLILFFLNHKEQFAFPFLPPLYYLSGECREVFIGVSELSTTMCSQSLSVDQWEGGRLSVSPPPTLPCVITAFTLPGCVRVCRHTRWLHINQSLLHESDTEEVYFLCFTREEWDWREERVMYFFLARGGPQRRSRRQ